MTGTFQNELSSIAEILQKENSYASPVGDYNINLLQMNKPEKYAELFNLMCTNKIALPTRCAKRTSTLIDQMFCIVLHQ